MLGAGASCEGWKDFRQYLDLFSRARVTHLVGLNTASGRCGLGGLCWRHVWSLEAEEGKEQHFCMNCAQRTLKDLRLKKTDKISEEEKMHGRETHSDRILGCVWWMKRFRSSCLSYRLEVAHPSIRRSSAQKASFPIASDLYDVSIEKMRE